MVPVRCLFLPSHPRWAGTQRISIAGNNPSAPDLKAPVRSLAISLEGADGQVWRTAMNTPPVMAVRWRAQPHGLSETPDVSTLEGEDALQNEFFHRLASGPVVFDLIFSFAQPSDDEADPTIPWPEDRAAHIAGQLIITDAQPQSSGQCNEINFDPLVLPTGIVPTADKILRARSAAYAESYRRRAYETWQQATEASH